MRNEKKEFTLLECVIVVAILLFVAGIAARKLVHSLKASEENTLHDAATQYLAVKNMYAEQSHAASADTFSVKSASVESIFSPPGQVATLCINAQLPLAWWNSSRRCWNSNRTRAIFSHGPDRKKMIVRRDALQHIFL